MYGGMYVCGVALTGFFLKRLEELGYTDDSAFAPSSSGGGGRSSPIRRAEVVQDVSQLRTIFNGSANDSGRVAIAGLMFALKKAGLQAPAGEVMQVLVQSGTDPQRGVSFVAFKRLVQQIAQMGPQYRREEKGKPKKRKRPQMSEEMSRTAWKVRWLGDWFGGWLCMYVPASRHKVICVAVSVLCAPQLFKQIDADGSGDLDVSEMFGAVKLLGISVGERRALCMHDALALALLSLSTVSFIWLEPDQLAVAVTVVFVDWLFVWLVGVVSRWWCGAGEQREGIRVDS